MNAAASASLVLDAELMKLLVCPVTRSPLVQEGDELVGTVGGLRYPIREGVPVLLAQEARLPAGVASLDEFRARYPLHTCDSKAPG
jgi:uncharacterized protein YbaR (Trm112 family)